MDLYISKRHIEVFLKVNETGSMSRAAELLYVTQPAVSQSIAELEQQVGVPLFERLKRKIFLTYAGEVFLDHVRRIHALFLETGFRMEAVAGLREERLRIGASMTIGSFTVPERIRSFLNTFPGVRVELTVDNTENIKRDLLSNSLDIAVIEGPMEHPDILLYPLSLDPLSLVCSPDHFPGKESLDPSDIAGEDFIMREEGSGTRNIIEQYFSRYQIGYRLRHVINNIEGIKKAVAAGLGISILPEIAIRNELRDGTLRALPVRGIAFARDFRYALHKDKIRTEVLDAWITLLLK